MRRKPLYVLPGSNPGLLVKGNIDINNRPQVKNPKGGISTVLSTSFGAEINGQEVEVLVPQVIPVGGKYKIVSAQQAKLYYSRTKQHLGIFDTWQHANLYSNKLHLQQARIFGLSGG